MIKIEDARYNSDEIKKYYPATTPDYASIVFEYKHYSREGSNSEIVTFESVEERDKTLEAMDKAFLIVKDGRVIDRDVPFYMEGGEFGGPGGMIPMQ
ncbi:hypothetical protein KAR91_68650 [Candidatus Pacearchaeota archaeon]|nr:hypothetical protein [Candidatus Pacearchaeota archaeon]